MEIQRSEIIIEYTNIPPPRQKEGPKKKGSNQFDEAGAATNTAKGVKFRWGMVRTGWSRRKMSIAVKSWTRRRGKEVVIRCRCGRSKNWDCLGARISNILGLSRSR